ncbi:MAG: EI24 domain-containing protein [Alphaproteobacteria bacterium]
MTDEPTPTRRPRGTRLGTAGGLATADLFSPPLLSILATTVLLNLALLLGLWFGIRYLLEETTFFSAGWLEWIVDTLGGLASVALLLILFPALATMILGMFLDSAASKVARRHYPWLPAGRDQPFGEMLAETVRFLAVMVVANLIALPVYLFVPALNVVVFYALNGYLIGREYFELVAVRYLPGPEARRLRARNRIPIFLAGVLVTLGLSIPFLNLVVPLWATALMVHVTAGILPDLRTEA